MFLNMGPSTKEELEKLHFHFPMFLGILYLFTHIFVILTSVENSNHYITQFSLNEQTFEENINK